MTIAILPARPSDTAAWLPLWEGYRAFYEVSAPPDLAARAWDNLLAPEVPMHAALAWDGDRAVGLIHLVRRFSTWTMGPQCYLEDLFVADDVRGRGVGRLLIDHGFDWARREGCSVIHWLTYESNHGARRIYDRIAEHKGHIHYAARLEP